MFNPFILSGMDVLGKKDLSNLLEKNPEIEKNYHKLWLASTNVLNTIINRATLNWSSFELEKIEKDIRLYVENESLNKALDVLKENHYVVISGIPGIGKTTLARMLVYTMLARGYEEFVYVDDMDTAAKMYDKGKRQIFFFDDLNELFFLLLGNKASPFGQHVVNVVYAGDKGLDQLFLAAKLR